jgi:hypothetical protein
VIVRVISPGPTTHPISRFEHDDGFSRLLQSSSSGEASESGSDDANVRIDVSPSARRHRHRGATYSATEMVAGTRHLHWAGLEYASNSTYVNS